MNQDDLSFFYSWFSEYVQSYYSKDPYVQMNIKSREEHTYRVCKNIVMIGRDMRLDEEQLQIGETIALFHDIGRFEQFETDFNRDSLNIILGPKESGKSTILRSILFAFGQKPKYFSLGKGVIRLRIFSDQSSVTLTSIGRNEATIGYQCLLLDDAFIEFHSPPQRSDNLFSELVNELNRHLNIQTIITAHTPLSTNSLPRTTRIISLENYPRYRQNWLS